MLPLLLAAATALTASHSPTPTPVPTSAPATPTVPAAATAPPRSPARPVLPPALPWTGASERLVVAADHPWITPAERAGFATTAGYAEVRAWLDRLAAASPLISVETFGSTSESRDLVFVRASKGAGQRPVVLVQAGIHAGEIDGKDAGLMLLRDIAMGGKAHLLDRVDLVFVPILNIDGHERTSAWNFPALRGPDQKGYQRNARNINLNRDYAKADAPETRAIITLLRRFDPILYVDCHVSDGFDMQYDITFTYAGWGRYARHRATADWLEGRFGPAATAALERAGHIPAIYPSPIDTRDPAKGIRYAPEGPRYSTGYGDFIGVPTVLVENHMLKPYRQRVLGTYVLLEEAIRLAGAEAPRIVAAKARDRASRPRTLLTKWQPAAAPIGWVDQFKGVAFDTYRSPVTGRDEQRWLARPITFRMPIIGQEATQRVTLPRAWWIPPAQAEVIDRLQLHGIRYEVLDEPRTLTLDRVRLVSPQSQPATDGRIPLAAADLVHEQIRETMPSGSIRVPVDQPLGLLAAALLEPESQDSFLAWGFFPELLSPAPGSEAFVLVPSAEALLANDRPLRDRFSAKLRTDPMFANDPDARLAWVLDQGSPRDPFHALYPIRREP